MRKQSKHKKRILQALCLVMALCGMSAYAMNVTGSNEVANILRSSSSVETLTINPNGGSATHIDGTTITSSTSKSLGSLIGIGETKSFSTGKQTIDIKGTYHFEVQGGKGGSATITGIGTAQGGDGVTIKSNSVSISKGKELTFHAGATSKDVTKPKIAAFNDVSGANQFGGTGTDVYKNGGSEYGFYDFSVESNLRAQRRLSEETNPNNVFWTTNRQFKFAKTYPALLGIFEKAEQENPDFADEINIYQEEIKNQEVYLNEEVTQVIQAMNELTNKLLEY